jgi:hypothetical protein
LLRWSSASIGEAGLPAELQKNGAKRSQRSPRVGIVSHLVDKSQHSADEAANLLEFKRVNSWQRSSFIEKPAGRRCPAASQPTQPLRRPAPRCSAVFKVILLTPANDNCRMAGLSGDPPAQTRLRTPPIWNHSWWITSRSGCIGSYGAASRRRHEGRYT